MFKFTRKTAEIVNYWLWENGFDCMAKIGNDMQYCDTDETIELPKFYNDEIDCYFMPFLRKMGLEENFDGITLSVLHEVGHYKTIPNFSDDDFETYVLAIDQLQIQDLPYEEFIDSYWKLPVEYQANAWLVNFSNKHPNKCQELENLIYSTLKWEW